jgi:ABC transport system ATP-binding/permease protein
MSLPIHYFKQLYLTFGSKPLFHNISGQICPKDRICLIGRNGSGKSTLLKIMAGIIEPDKGELYYQPKTKIGYLAQQPIINSNDSIIEYVMQNIKLENNELLEHKRYLAEIILDKLKLQEDKILDQLSGGQLRRADLARVLVMENDLLFLDEPTNHLDIPSINWLEEYLNNFNGGLVIVSHDRAFLRNISNRTIWLDRGKLLYNHLGYSNFDSWSEECLIKEERELVNLGKELDKENLWLQQGVTARRKRNQQRLSALHALRDKMKNDKSRFNNINNKIKLDLQDVKNKSKLLLECNEVSFSIDESCQTILKPFSLTIMKGEIIGIMGPNGAGKTTLVKLITGEIQPSSGSIKYGANLEYSYIDQARSSLDLELTLCKTLCPQGGDTIFLGNKEKHVIAYLKDFFFDAKQAHSKISTLSGGEQNRLLLAKLMINPGNVLILDEPTNDLDVDTLDMLVEILSDYKGTLIIVSHDRDFLERLVTRTIIIDQETVQDFVGGYHEYFISNTKEIKKDKIYIKKNKKEKSFSKLSYKDQRELDLLPDIIDKLSQEIKELETHFHNQELYLNDPDSFHAISNTIIKKKQELDRAEMRWFELEEQAELLLRHCNKIT